MIQLNVILLSICLIPNIIHGRRPSFADLEESTTIVTEKDITTYVLKWIFGILLAIGLVTVIGVILYFVWKYKSKKMRRHRKDAKSAESKMEEAVRENDINCAQDKEASATSAPRPDYLQPSKNCCISPAPEPNLKTTNILAKKNLAQSKPSNVSNKAEQLPMVTTNKPIIDRQVSSQEIHLAGTQESHLSIVEYTQKSRLEKSLDNTMTEAEATQKSISVSLKLPKAAHGEMLSYIQKMESFLNKPTTEE